MTATLQIPVHLTKGLSQEYLRVLLLILEERRCTIEEVGLDAVREFIENHAPAEVQLPLMAMNGSKLSPAQQGEETSTSNGEVRA